MSLIELLPAVCVVGGSFFGAFLGAQHSVAGAILGAIFGVGGGLLFYFAAVFCLALVCWFINRAAGGDTSLFTPQPKHDSKP